MASKRPYECFRCRDNGFPGVQGYLAGKDEQGKTIQLEEDGTAHQHKQKQEQRLQQQEQVTEESIKNLLITINEKLDRLLNLAERK